MEIQQKIKYIGVQQDAAKEIFADSSQAQFDAIYARAEEIFGRPVLVQILNSTPEEAVTAIINMVNEVYPGAEVERIDTF